MRINWWNNVIADIPTVNQPQSSNSKDCADTNIQDQWWWSLVLAKHGRLGSEQTVTTTNTPNTDNHDDEPQEARQIGLSNATEPKPKKSRRKKRKTQKSFHLEHTDSVHPLVNEAAQEASTLDGIVSGCGLSEVIAQNQAEPPSSRSKPAHKSAICPVTLMRQDQTSDSQTLPNCHLDHFSF